MLSDGGWVVTWNATTEFDGGFGSDFYQQRYNADGSHNGGISKVNTTTLNSIISTPSIAGLSDGGWIVLWSDAASGNVYFQAYNQNGALKGSETSVELPVRDNILDLSVAGVSDGGWVVTWHGDYHNPATGGDESAVYMQRFNADGSTKGIAEPVSAGYGNISHPAITTLSDGGWVVTWEAGAQFGGPGRNTYQQRYDEDGRKIGVEVLVNTTYNGDIALDTSVTALSDGGWIVTWVGKLGTKNLYQQRYNSDGTPVFEEDQIVYTTYWGNSIHASVTGLSDGSWIVTWTDSGKPDIIQQHYNAAGETLGNPVIVNTSEAVEQEYHSVTELSEGGWVVTWIAGGQIYQQHFDAEGHKVPAGDTGHEDDSGADAKVHSDVISDFTHVTGEDLYDLSQLETVSEETVPTEHTGKDNIVGFIVEDLLDGDTDGAINLGQFGEHSGASEDIDLSPENTPAVGSDPDTSTSSAFSEPHSIYDMPSTGASSVWIEEPDRVVA
jgi:hypothetical protein